MAEVCGLFRAEISVQLSGYDWTSCTLVPEVHCVSREVVMFPAAKDIIGDGVEVVAHSVCYCHSNCNGQKNFLQDSGEWQI